ncbi:LCP family protein [Candidatus Daviesbacteria bacterium]|nr:LCP family protein [Candidatus Daviesbacteria bacterium]
MRRIDLELGEKSNLKTKRFRKILRKFLPIGLVISALIFLAIFLSTFSGSSPVVNLIITGTSLASDEGRVNVLLLGMAGGKHDGATLTDTILVGSYDLKNKQLHLISIPRDLWLPALQSKTNAVYQTGLKDRNGLSFAKTVIGNVIGLPIQYSLRIDFHGFVEAIDAMGGIEVEVSKTFDDYNYPITGKENDLCGYKEEEKDFSEDEAKALNIEAGIRKVFISPEGRIATDSAQEDQGAKYFSCRYEHLYFDKGLNLMDGETALKFVRSRHGTSGEGSDFARSKRQEKVIQAIRDKVLSVETLTNPKKLGDLLQVLGKNIDTDISLKDATEFFKLTKDLKQTHSIVLDDSIFFHPSSQDYGGAYVLISQDDDFTTIHQYIKRVFEEDIKNAATSSARER